MRIRIYTSKTQKCAEIYRDYDGEEGMASCIIGYKWWHVIKFLLTFNNYRKYSKSFVPK